MICCKNVIILKHHLGGKALLQIFSSQQKKCCFTCWKKTSVCCTFHATELGEPTFMLRIAKEKMIQHLWHNMRCYSQRHNETLRRLEIMRSDETNIGRFTLRMI